MWTELETAAVAEVGESVNTDTPDMVAQLVPLLLSSIVTTQVGDVVAVVLAFQQLNVKQIPPTPASALEANVPVPSDAVGVNELTVRYFVVPVAAVSNCVPRFVTVLVAVLRRYGVP